MTCFSHPECDDHKSVVFCADAASGLRAIIAIHDTTLGPALGSCRVRTYENDNVALRDVLRLSRGMSYKNALAGLPLGIPLQGEAVGMEERKRRAGIIRSTTLEVLERAARENVPPHVAADCMAQEIISNAGARPAGHRDLPRSAVMRFG
jgi:hypothetical protein